MYTGYKKVQVLILYMFLLYLKRMRSYLKNMRIYINKQMRRAMRKFILRYGPQDTRKIIYLFAEKYSVPWQQVSGNLRALKYCDGTVGIQTIIPCRVSIAR